MSDKQPWQQQVNYSYGEVVTPFNRAQQTWDRPIGFWHAKAYFWRKMSLLILAVNALLTVILVLILSSPNVRIWVAQVNASGFIESVGLLKPSKMIPGSVAQTFIKVYLSNLYRTDPASQAFAKAHIKPALWSDLQKSIHPGRVQNVVIQQTGSDQFKVNWQVAGANAVQNYQARISLGRSSLKSQAEVMQNPFGFIISQLSMQTTGSNSHG